MPFPHLTITTYRPNVAYINWLIDDHRARLARYATSQPGALTHRFSHFQAHFVVDSSKVCWVDGVPATHNQDIQYWRSRLDKTAWAELMPSLRKEAVRHWIQRNLTYSR